MFGGEDLVPLRIDKVESEECEDWVGQPGFLVRQRHPVLDDIEWSGMVGQTHKRKLPAN